MWCRRCCIDNMLRILNNDSEAVLRGITKQRTLECASRRVRTLEKSIWTRGTLLAPSLPVDVIINALLSIPCYRVFVPLLSPPPDTFLFLFSWDTPVRNIIRPPNGSYAHTLLIRLLNNWENSSVLHKQSRVVHPSLPRASLSHFICFKNHIHIFRFMFTSNHIKMKLVYIYY